MWRWSVKAGAALVITTIVDFADFITTNVIMITLRAIITTPLLSVPSVPVCAHTGTFVLGLCLARAWKKIKPILMWRPTPVLVLWSHTSKKTTNNCAFEIRMQWLDGWMDGWMWQSGNFVSEWKSNEMCVFFFFFIAASTGLNPPPPRHLIKSL